jgi:hypothetical protein
VLVLAVMLVAGLLLVTQALPRWLLRLLVRRWRRHRLGVALLRCRHTRAL